MLGSFTPHRVKILRWAMLVQVALGLWVVGSGLRLRSGLDGKELATLNEHFFALFVAPALILVAMAVFTWWRLGVGTSKPQVLVNGVVCFGLALTLVPLAVSWALPAFGLVLIVLTAFTENT